MGWRWYMLSTYLIFTFSTLLSTMSPITGFISYRRSNYLMFFLGMLAGTLLFCLLSTHTNSDPGVILHADFVETQNFHARDDPDHKLGYITLLLYIY